MTEQQVRDELPDIEIRYSDHARTYPATISGRLNDFATVTRKDTGMQWQFSWSTLARCITEGRAPRV